jgi:transcription initiation factor TFIIIB Brf1 subunit/transcription initiation factor TFIIB
LFLTSSDILRKISNADRGGRSPYAFAVSTVYAAEKLLAKSERRKSVITQKLLAEITGVAEYTIREHFCTVLKKLVKAN